MRTLRFLTAAVLTLASAAALAQSWGRAGTWEAGFNVLDTSSERFGGSRGTGLAVSGETSLGFTGGYNFTDRLALMGDFNYIRPSYDATFLPEGGGDPETISATMDVTSLHAKGVFHFFTGDFTPYVEAGIGWTEIDSNIIDGPPITGCWWDPWWGYICSTFYNTYKETRTSYTTSFGIRWDLNSDMVVRAAYGLFEVDRSNNSENAEFDTIQVGFSWRF
jgi:opacity protein-like surface antigen